MCPLGSVDVGRVEAIEVVGLDLWFNTSDHREAHFHAKRSGHWEIRVYLNETTSSALSYDFKFGGEPLGKVRRELARLVSAHREALLAEWERKVQLKGP